MSRQTHCGLLHSRKVVPSKNTLVRFSWCSKGKKMEGTILTYSHQDPCAPGHPTTHYHCNLFLKTTIYTCYGLIGFWSELKQFGPQSFKLMIPKEWTPILIIVFVGRTSEKWLDWIRLLGWSQQCKSWWFYTSWDRHARSPHPPCDALCCFTSPTEMPSLEAQPMGLTQTCAVEFLEPWVKMNLFPL